MPIRSDILDKLAARGVDPSRAVKRALDELLAVVAEENPDLPPPSDEDEDDGGDDDAGLAVRTIACPHCGEAVVVELELDGGDQEAIHDCSVCCRPIQLRWRVRAGRLDDLRSGPG